MADIMQVEKMLPADFDGVFRFTNWTDEEFVGVWAKKEYHFPPNATSPILIMDATPLEIQNIRKKFAKDLAEREYFKSVDYKRKLKQERNEDGTPRLNSIHMATTYSIETLTPFIQKALTALPVKKAMVTDAPLEPLESKLSRNQDGELNSEAVDRKVSLRKKALES